MVIFVIIIIKIAIINIIAIAIITIFLSYAQNVVFDVRKKMYKLPEMGRGGEVIRAMPERKHSFSGGVHLVEKD